MNMQLTLTEQERIIESTARTATLSYLKKLAAVFGLVNLAGFVGIFMWVRSEATDVAKRSAEATAREVVNNNQTLIDDIGRRVTEQSKKVSEAEGDVSQLTRDLALIETSAKTVKKLAAEIDVSGQERIAKLILNLHNHPNVAAYVSEMEEVQRKTEMMTIEGGTLKIPSLSITNILTVHSPSEIVQIGGEDDGHVVLEVTNKKANQKVFQKHVVSIEGKSEL